MPVYCAVVLGIGGCYSLNAVVDLEYIEELLDNGVFPIPEEYTKESILEFLEGKTLREILLLLGLDVDDTDEKTAIPGIQWYNQVTAPVYGAGEIAVTQLINIHQTALKPLTIGATDVNRIYTFSSDNELVLDLAHIYDSSKNPPGAKTSITAQASASIPASVAQDSPHTP